MIAGIVLAAGESRRMGSPKPLLGWKGRPLVRYQVEQLRAAGCDAVVVVLGSRADRVQPFTDGLRATVVINNHFAEGRATSVRAGAALVPASAEWIAVLGVDQPRPAAVMRPLFQAAADSDADILVPVYGGRRGHPVLFSGRLLGEMRDVQDATLGLRAVVHRHLDHQREVPIDSPLIHVDMNTPAAYVAALAAR
ncbi:MAG: nucleotidyltransferase family protein [Dehalococcoidia bacterium]|nr:nucleotidyltransferase family protein [Dehalococcoidia bacterium]